MDMLEGQVWDERDPDLNEEEYIRMEYSREQQWGNVAEDGDDMSKIHSLMWYVYTRENEYLIQRFFWCPFRI